MGKARDLARLSPNSSGLLPNANIEAVAASKLTGQVPDASAPSGSVIQVVSLAYTDVFSTSASQTTRIPVTNFFVDITPISSTSKLLIIANLAVGFSSTPEWSWFVDRTIGGTTTQVGNAAYVGNRMNGYHGGPQDSSSDVYDVYSYSHTILDTPNTTSSIRYQVCMQDRWQNFTAKHINRTGNDDNTGYTTRGSSGITVMEIAA